MSSSRPRPATNRSSLMGVVRREPLGAAAFAVLLLIIMMSVAAPWIAPNDPYFARVDLVDSPPNSEYLLGGDGSGRDIFSRLITAGRSSLFGALIAVAIAAVVGTIGGLIAGYASGMWDSALNWTFDAMMTLPTMVVLLALVPTLGSSMYLSMVALGVLLSPGVYRLVRALVVGMKNELYVDAARVSGLSSGRIVSRHILLIIRAPVLVHLSIVAGFAVLLQSGLEFLGFGDARTITWGGMIDDAVSAIYTEPLAMIWPGAMITVTVSALVILGNTVGDALAHRDAPADIEQEHSPDDITFAATEAQGASDASEAQALLSVRELRIAYGDGAPVVDGVSLDVRRGEVLGLVGESGSGKTQTTYALLNMLSGGGRITGGSIVFDRAELTVMPPDERRKLMGTRIGYIPQDPMNSLDPSFRIGFHLIEPLKAVHGLTRTQANEHALELLVRVGFTDPHRVLDAYPHELSGGMAQRVLIAGAVAGGPDLLIADEPTSALDVTVQADVLDLLRGLQREREMGVILVTHDLGVVADICDRVAVMRGGRIVETAEVTELFAAPQHPYPRLLLDSALENRPPRRFVGQHGRSDDGDGC